MGDIVIVAYRPHAGREAALAALVADHVPHLRRLGLATDRPEMAMRAADGTIVEVFEWREGGVEAAHAMPEIQEMWADFAAVCRYTPLRDVPEAAAIFATFQPL